MLIEEIPPELVLNWDQTGLNAVPALVWTWDKEEWKWLASKINGKSLLFSVAPFKDIFSQFKWYLHSDVISSLVFQNVGTLLNLPNGGQMRRLCCNTKLIIILPYIHIVREMLGGENLSALVLIKGQITIKVQLCCLLLPNLTELLQPLDVSINKPAKSLLKHKFQELYTEEIFK